MSHNLDILIRNYEYSAECCIYIKQFYSSRRKRVIQPKIPLVIILNVKMDLSFYSEFKAAM